MFSSVGGWYLNPHIMAHTVDRLEDVRLGKDFFLTPSLFILKLFQI